MNIHLLFFIILLINKLQFILISYSKVFVPPLILTECTDFCQCILSYLCQSVLTGTLYSFFYHTLLYSVGCLNFCVCTFFSLHHII